MSGLAICNPMALNINDTSDRDFESFVLAEREKLVRFAWGMLSDSHEAEDIAQEALIRLLPKYERVDNPRAYLYKSITNLCLQRLQKQNRKMPTLLKSPDNNEDPALCEEKRTAVRRALDLLTEQQRTAVLLREVE